MSAATEEKTDLVTNVSVERGEDGVAAITIEVAPEAVKATRERVIKELSKRVKVPGFRPGHVPVAIVRRNVGDEAISQNVSDELVPQAYQAALEKEGLVPLERAEVDTLTFDSFDGEKPLQFTARVVLRPEITLGELKGLTVTYPTVDVTDEDVEKGLEELRGQRAEMKDVEDRGAQNGDIISAELNVFMDGKPHSDEPSNLRGFILGESGFVPSIDEHLVDAKVGEERRFTVKYEDDFKDADLAGKEAEFAVTISGIKERILPELDEEFVKTLGMDSVEAVRARMKQAITEGRTREAIEAVRTDLVDAAVESANFEAPSKTMHERAHQRLHNAEAELQQRGATLDDYLQSIGKTRDEFSDDVHAEAEKELKQELVLDEIARREELAADNREIEMHYHQMAYVTGQPVEEIVKALDWETARGSVLQRKAVDWLVEHADIVDGEGNKIENFGQLPQFEENNDIDDAALAAATEVEATEVETADEAKSE
ncbi:MAG TPA: trigger factor [Abditibacteriaceae bacterium]|jgi:trigger factor